MYIYHLIFIFGNILKLPSIFKLQSHVTSCDINNLILSIAVSYIPKMKNNNENK